MPDMSINSLSNDLGEAARTYLWEVVIPRPIGGGNSKMLTLRCQSSQIPGRGVGSILIPYKQTAGMKVPGKLTYDHSIDLSFVEGEDRAVFLALYDWCNSIISDRTGVAGSTSSIKTDIYMNLMNTDGSIPLSIRLVGGYLETLSSTPMNYNDEGNVFFSSVWSYDSWHKV